MDSATFQKLVEIIEHACLIFLYSDQRQMSSNRQKVQAHFWPRVHRARTVFLLYVKEAHSNLVLFFSLIEPQNKRTPDLPEEDSVKEEVQENEEAVKKTHVEATPEFEEVAVC